MRPAEPRGLLIPEPHQWSDPEPFVDLERASLERWRDLEQRLPGGVGLVELDWIGLAPHPGGFAAHQPPAVEWLAPGQVEQLVPEPGPAMEGALIRRQARVNPLRAVARLAAGLPAIATGVAATAVTIRGSRLVTVTTSRRGHRAPAAWSSPPASPPMLDGLPLHIPSDRVKGHLLVTEPTDVALPGIVAPVATQLEDGRLLAGGTFDLGDEDPGRPAGRHRRRSSMASPRYCPASTASRSPTSGAASGHGTRTGGRSSIRVPGLDNAWLTSGHFRTGILNAPRDRGGAGAAGSRVGQPSAAPRHTGRRCGSGGQAVTAGRAHQPSAASAGPSAPVTGRVPAGRGTRAAGWAARRVVLSAPGPAPR